MGVHANVTSHGMIGYDGMHCRLTRYLAKAGQPVRDPDHDNIDLLSNDDDDADFDQPLQLVN